MNRTVTVRLIASTAQFQAAMGAAAAQTRAIEGDMRRLAVQGDQSMRMLGKGMLVAGGLIAGGLALSVAKAMEFEREMRNVNSITKLGEEQFAATSQQVLALSRTVPQSAATLAKGLYDIASSGFAGADGMKILESSAISATAGMTTTDVAARAITATLNAYGRNARDAGDISDVLFKTVEVGVITFEELASGMGDWVGMASAAKVPVDEASAAIAAMTLSGVGAAESGTSLNRVLQQLISPSDALKEQLRELGYESGAQALETDGLRGVMEKLREATGGNITQLQALFPEVRALRGVLALTANEGQNFGNTIDAITDKQKRAGAAQAAYAEQSKALAVQWELAKSSATAFAIEVGNRLLPALSGLAQQIGGLFDSFSSLPGPVITAGVALAGVSAVALTLGGGLLLLAPRIHATNVALQAMGPAGMKASSALSGLMGLVSKGLVFGALAWSLNGVATSLQNLYTTRVSAGKLVSDLELLATTGEKTGDVLKGFGQDFGDLIKGVEAINNRGWADRFLEGTMIMDTGTEALRKRVHELDRALAEMVTGGNADAAALAFDAMKRAMLAADISIDEINRAFPEYTVVAGQAADASAEVSAEAEAERKKIKELGEQLGVTAGQTEELSEAQKLILERIDGVNKAIGSFSDPINSYNAALEANKTKAQEWADAHNEGLEKTKVSWKDYPGLVKEGLSGEALEANKEKAKEWAEAQNEAVGKAKVSWEDAPGGIIPSLKQIEEELDKNQEAFDNWANNLGTLVQRGYGALAMELASKGPEYAGLVQQFVDAPSDELARIAPKWVGAQRRATEGTADEIIRGALIQQEYARQGAGATVETVAGVLEMLPEEVKRIARDMGLEVEKATPSWTNKWWALTWGAMDATRGMQRDVPPVVRSTVVDAERQVAGNAPAWGSQWWNRYWGARNPTEAMRRDVPPIVAGTGMGMVNALAGGLDPFRRTVGGYTGALEHGIRTVNVSAGASWANVPEAVRREFKGRADGAVVDYYASGGFKEKHVAEIARAGDWRVWAEPETGGEAYIPLAQSKRDRSVPIWLETGRRLGLDEDSLDALRGVMAFHEGGLWRVPGVPPLEPFGHPIRPRGEASLHSARGLAEAVAQAHMKLPHHTVPQLTGGIGYQAMMAALRVRFPGLQLISGLRPGAITATGNPSYHGMGRAVDIPPRLDVNRWIYDNYKAQTRELIFSQAGARQIKNGADYRFTGITRAMHFDHNHWAMALGGLLDGFHGLRSYDRGGELAPGYTLAHNGTGRPEMVVPSASRSVAGPTVTIRTTHQWYVDGELGPSSRRELERMMDDNNRDLVTMVEQRIG
jgi:TP901 family phage tail tape measure protein